MKYEWTEALNFGTWKDTSMLLYIMKYLAVEHISKHCNVDCLFANSYINHDRSVVLTYVHVLTTPIYTFKLLSYLQVYVSIIANFFFKLRCPIIIWITQIDSVFLPFFKELGSWRFETEAGRPRWEQWQASGLVGIRWEILRLQTEGGRSFQEGEEQGYAALPWSKFQKFQCTAGLITKV